MAKRTTNVRGILFIESKVNGYGPQFEIEIVTEGQRIRLHIDSPHTLAHLADHLHKGRRAMVAHLSREMNQANSSMEDRDRT